MLFGIQNKNQNHNIRRLFYADKNKKILLISSFHYLTPMKKDFSILMKQILLYIV